MIDTALYVTGALVWLVGAVVVAFFLPIVGAFAVGYPTYKLKSVIEDRYYDGVEDVEQAKADGAWHYYVGHYALLVRDKAVAFVEWYLKRTVDPVFRRLP